MAYEPSKPVDVAQLQTLTDLFNQATAIPLTATDARGSTLAQSGSMQLCDLLRQNPRINRRCIRNVENITAKANSGRKYVVEKCWNGLFDTLMPIAAFGESVGYFVAGPFLLTRPEAAYSRRQSRRFGFDESAYLQALSKVPVVDAAKLDAFLQCFSVFCEILAQAGEKKLTDEIERWKQRTEVTSLLQENILSNMKELVLPYVEKLKKSATSSEQSITIEILEMNLREITSPVIRQMQTFGLSSRESTVASLIKEGKATRQIAEQLGVSARAVEYHRYNIRRKLGLCDRKIDLADHLLSMD